MKSLEIHFLTDWGGGGGGGWFAPILVRKGDYFLILCKKLFQNFLITITSALRCVAQQCCRDVRYVYLET